MKALRGVDSADNEFGEEEIAYADPDAATDDSPVGGEHLDGTVPFESIKSNVSQETYSALTDRPMRLTTMTPVQAQVMALLPDLAAPHAPVETNEVALKGRKDLLIQAKTGTGKTLAFLIPAIEQRIRTLAAVGKQAAIDAGKPDDAAIAERAARAYARTNVGTLIISPTRELATQIANEAIRAVSNHKEFEVRLFVGGISKGVQMRDYMRGRRDIVVATTGRLLDLLRSEPELQDGMRGTQLVRFPS